VSEHAPGTSLIEGGSHRFVLRVYYEDTDAGGLVYHANYLAFAERARSEFVRLLGIEQSRLREEEGVIFVVAAIGIRYLAPARLDDVLEVRSEVTALGPVRLSLQQAVTRRERVLARLDVELACLDLREGRSRRMPSWLHQTFVKMSPYSSASQHLQSED